MSARFWVPMADGVVRVKLAPGRPLQWHRDQDTDEGWQAEGECWRIEGDHVLRFSHSDGRDCDGRFATYSVTACRLDRLDAHEFDGVRFPAWEPREESQRDYSAEAAGY